ncbi:phage minor capsid protein [[Ruminococcus] torques]|nr:phage minor capsid protein [[Ruminococcus] torques]
MREDYKKQLSGQIEKNFSDLEIRIMEDIVRRIRKTGEITSTADWQINRLKILGYSSEDIENMLKEALGKSYPEMFELYDKVIDWEYVRNKEVYEQVNAEFIPYEENEELQQITEGLIRQSGAELQNITKVSWFLSGLWNRETGIDSVGASVPEVFGCRLHGYCIWCI